MVKVPMTEIVYLLESCGPSQLDGIPTLHCFGLASECRSDRACHVEIIAIYAECHVTAMRYP
jgi:hypothetical protein